MPAGAIGRVLNNDAESRQAISDGIRSLPLGPGAGLVAFAQQLLDAALGSAGRSQIKRLEELVDALGNLGEFRSRRLETQYLDDLVERRHPWRDILAQVDATVPFPHGVEQDADGGGGVEV